MKRPSAYEYESSRLVRYTIYSSQALTVCTVSSLFYTNIAPHSRKRERKRCRIALLLHSHLTKLRHVKAAFQPPLVFASQEWSEMHSHIWRRGRWDFPPQSNGLGLVIIRGMCFYVIHHNELRSSDSKSDKNVHSHSHSSPMRFSC